MALKPLDPLGQGPEPFQSLRQLVDGGLLAEEAMIVGGWDLTDSFSIRDVAHDRGLRRDLYVVTDVPVMRRFLM